MIYYPSGRVSIQVNFTDSPDDYYVFGALPKFAKVEINSYQQADEFEIKFDYSAFPIDPRAVKSCGVGIWIGDTKKFGDLVEDDVDKCLITGFVDDFDLNFAEDDCTITLKGRDFTGILLDNKWFHGNVPLDLPLDECIRWILDHDPAFDNIEVINMTGEQLPALSACKIRPYEQHTPDKEDSYWDIIYELVLQTGLICYMQLDKLVIHKAKSLYMESKITNFIYGANLKELRFQKKFGRNQGLNIEVRSYDPTTKSTLSAMYPDPPIDKKQMVIPSMNTNTNPKTERIHTKPVKVAKSNKKSTSKSGKSSEKAGPSENYEITTFTVSNIRDVNKLKEIAENIWNQLSRREVEGSFSTHDFKGLEDTDYTELRNGDAVCLTIGDQFKKVINTMPYEQKIDFLVNNGFDRTVAKEISNSMDKLDKVFYIQKVRHEWDNSEGYSLSVDFINYLNIPGGVTGGD